MGVELKESLAQNLNLPDLLRGFLLTGEDRNVLFIDEIHELTSSLALPAATIQQIVEPPLIEDGFIEKSDTGSRQLTAKGRRHTLDLGSDKPDRTEVSNDA